ncbi:MULTISPECIES: formylglycine-generating enzyme family protein [unclassified Caballeronia]|jgi:formylglycine-generating enzyme required for sulfatase activity|uniref:formylglycine-generating enzyme family protein n=1 Tax=unclassified Caballeronia TaxID=2646786 RepID=UPI00202941BB|nr:MULTISPECIES: formylglycine-generating enzyme family protein [unclassified Caballeronia]
MKSSNKHWHKAGAVALALFLTGTAIAAYQHFKGPAPLAVGDGAAGPKDMVWIPGGDFLMGSEHPRALPNERPAHEVRLHGYWIDRHDVTNAQFARFVAATGYLTTAERKPRWEDLAVQLPPGTPRPADDTLVPGGLVFTGTDAPVALNDYSRWWKFVPGANWRHPTGPDSSIAGKETHPVVQVSYEDALAYAHWAHKRLPTEAEWEYAARGGLEQADYAWGNEFTPRGKKMANTWDDTARPFPVTLDRGSQEKVQVGTTAVGSFAPNGYGLYDMAGNVWQWVADWYRADAFRIESASGRVVSNPSGPSSSYDPDNGPTASAPERVTRGGSFLCSETYCISYRTSARRGTDPMNGMSHLGFRLAMDQDDWEREARH